MPMEINKEAVEGRNLVLSCNCGRTTLIIRNTNDLRPKALMESIPILVTSLELARRMFCGCSGLEVKE